MINKISTPVITNKKAEKTKQQTFKGAGTAVLGGLRELNSSPAIGACAVDLCSMVIPRTVIETKKRGKNSGIETGFREGSSSLLNACVGLIGFGVASLISGGFNNKYGVKAQNIFANSDTINNMSSMWQNSGGQSKQFFESFVQNIKGLNGSEWKTVSEGAKDGIVDNLVKLADKTQQLASATGQNKSALSKEVKQLKSVTVSSIVKDTGAQASFRLNAANGAKEVSSSLGELVDSAVGLSNSFKKQTKETLPSFVKSLKSNKTAATVIGLAICAAIGMSVQPINKYLTKKRTGQDGFVGSDGDKGDNSKKFKAAKTAAGIAFPVAAISSIGKPKELISNVQFNSKIPTMNQFKFLYGLTLGSRFMSARDSNELRESMIKDTLGYVNWLILGGMVSKVTARAIGGKELINNPVAAKDGAKKGVGYALKWLSKASVKSYDEVLLPKAKEITKDGKMLKFSELYKKADSATKSQVHKIAGSQIAGYLYSGLVLGVGISKLNIFLTNRARAKKKAGQTNKVIAGKNLDLEYLAKNTNKMSTVFKDFK